MYKELHKENIPFIALSHNTLTALVPGYSTATELILHAHCATEFGDKNRPTLGIIFGTKC